MGFRVSDEEFEKVLEQLKRTKSYEDVSWLLGALFTELKLQEKEGGPRRERLERIYRAFAEKYGCAEEIERIERAVDEVRVLPCPGVHGGTFPIQDAKFYMRFLRRVEDEWVERGIIR
jgi:hypothetical protein